MCACAQGGQKRVINSPKAGVPVGCELPTVDSRNQAQVFCNENMRSTLLSHLSRPQFICFLSNLKTMYMLCYCGCIVLFHELQLKVKNSSETKDVVMFTFFFVNFQLM